MLNNVKVLFAGEKAVRDINKSINETLINQLTRDDLSSEEKKEIADKAKEFLADNAKMEEDNSKFWYKYGKNEGELKGVLKALGIFAVGFAIGTILVKR